MYNYFPIVDHSSPDVVDDSYFKILLSFLSKKTTKVYCWDQSAILFTLSYLG